MKQIRLIFGTHNSLPISNDKKLLESVYQKAYKPFISVLNRFPHIPVVLHYSGYLLEWIERKHPEFIMLLTEMVKRKQVEFLTGGFYEPVLT
ncbi:4-alpha-glucanotransferase, partial [bacterium]|nr:4-alpha-glucanotransferase [bacterium]